MEYRTGNFVFDEWEIVRKIGTGASGVVYEIRKTDHDVTLTSALKVMRVPKNASVASSLYSDGLDQQSVTSYLQDVVDELIGEIKLMVSMKGFPYVVSCEDYKVLRDSEAARWDVLIRMELLKPLQQYQQEQDMTEADVRRLGVQLSRALMLFEERHMIHRDIKPENIFVTPFGDFKLGDFGIARIYDKASGNLSKKGTENYMAPEIYRGGEYDNRADIYALGLVLYRALNKNRLPFYPLDVPYKEIDRQQALVDRLCGQRKLTAPALASPEFGRIVLKMCAYRQEDRYETAAELLRDLEALRPSGQVVLSRIHSPVWGRTVSEGAGAKGGKIRDLEEKDQDDEDVTNRIFAGKPRKRIGSHSDPGQRPVPGGEEDTGDRNPTRKENPPESRISGDGRRAQDGGADQKKQAEPRGEKSRPTRGGTDGAGKGQIPREEREAAPGRKGNRKFFIQLTAAAAIVIAIAVPLYLSREYTLIVNGGSGSGSYKAGSTVTVRAQEVEGSSFAGWEATGMDLAEAERSCEEVSIDMPRREVTLTAVYEENEYTVTVNGGSGSGNYKLDDTVTIEADAPQEGYQFEEWEITSGGAAIADPSASKTSFQMREEDVVVTAAYKALEYELTVDGASGSGTYAYGDRITLEAEEIEHNTFEGWAVQGEKLDFTEEELSAPRLTFDMPAEDVQITAQYRVNQYSVTVNGGDGSGTYQVGDRVTITAAPAEEGSQFTSWKVNEGSVTLSDPGEMEVSFTMPDEAVELTAQYDLTDYVLTVNNGNGSGTYHLGDQAAVSADPLRDGMTFSHWTVDQGTLTLADMAVPNISFTMPAEDLTLTAHYAIQKYTLKVTNGTGSGMYSPGDQVEISADPQDGNGNTFAYWSVAGGSLDLEQLGIDAAQPTLRFSMPEENFELQANYGAGQTAFGEYTLTVNGGSGSGTYAAGDTVVITRDEAPEGMKFAYWLLNQAGADAVTYKTEVLTLTMPANDVIVTAVFEDQL